MQRYGKRKTAARKTRSVHSFVHSFVLPYIVSYIVLVTISGVSPPIRQSSVRVRSSTDAFHRGSAIRGRRGACCQMRRRRCKALACWAGWREAHRWTPIFRRKLYSRSDRRNHVPTRLSAQSTQVFCEFFAFCILHSPRGADSLPIIIL